MDRKWVIVAFGDMSNFMEWSLRASNSPEVQGAFINALYDRFQVFVTKTNSEVFKYLGDGFMVLKELPEKGHKCRDAIPYLKEAFELTNDINSLIGKFSPRPNRFRVRATAGHVFRLEVADPNHRQNNIYEHVGSCIDLAKRLLEVKPEISCICHQSVVDIFPKAGKAKFKKVVNVRERPRNVAPSELQCLVEFRFK